MKAAILIDRDGTLNEEVEYLHRVEDTHLIPGAAKAIAKLNALNIPVIVITNQAGIGRGKYGWSEYRAVMGRIDELLAREGARLDGEYACPYHPSGEGDYAHEDHPDRKPNPGMLLRAAEEHGLDLTRSWMIGDKDIDLEAGRNVGCRVALVKTGYGAQMDGSKADVVAENLAEAIEKILELS